jgi:predicted nucleic acid-binding protein
MEGLTFDTGALIALERRSRRMWAVWRRASERGVPVTVPSAVVAEWWRGQRGPIGRLLDGVDVEPLSAELAKIVGEALGAVRDSTIVDVIVMASAAQRGDVVYTADHEDLTRLNDRFPGVRLLRT